MKKVLPSLRVKEETINNMKSALSRLNKDSVIEMSENDFRRYAYELTSQMILLGWKTPKIQLQK